jgi:hypothetical protein
LSDKKITKQKTGRPSLYRPEYCQRLIAWGKQGLSYESFASDVDVCVDTLYEWEKVHKEFSDAKKKASAYSRAWWERMGQTGMLATGFSASVWIFNMKNRFGWRDRQPEEAADDADAVAARVINRINALSR